MSIDLAATMDAIAQIVIDEIHVRAYPYPSEQITAPCVVVGYPENITFDMTFNRGSDLAVYPLYYIVGNKVDRNARDALSIVINGAVSFKEHLDGDLNGTVNSATITDCRIENLTLAGSEYLAARFDLQVYS